MSKAPNPFKERTEKDGLAEIMAEESAKLKEKRATIAKHIKITSHTVSGSWYTHADMVWMWENGLNAQEKAWLEAWWPVIKERSSKDEEVVWDLAYRRSLAILHQINKGEAKPKPDEGMLQRARERWEMPG